jgi:hypothetical protein
MRADEAGTRQVRAVRALVGILAMLAVGIQTWAGEFVVADDSSAEITAKAGTSAGELATSLRSIERSLRTAAPVAYNGDALSAEEYAALAEAGAKKELAALADELDQLSAALARGNDPEGEKLLLESVGRRAGELSLLGAGPWRIPIPSGMQAELLTLWSDVRALAATRAGEPVPMPFSELEAAR